MCKSILFLIGLFPCFLLANASDPRCTDSIVRGKYLEELREVAQWDDQTLLPYAEKYCDLSMKNSDLLKERLELATTLISNNGRICMDLEVQDNQDVCVKAYIVALDKMITQCEETLYIGHNPHNVAIPLFESSLSNSCLEGQILSLKRLNH